MGASVHFWGKDNVLIQYRNLDIPAWTLWQGSQMLPFKYDGDDIDEGAEYLNRVFSGMSESTNALYTLKVYEDIAKGAKLTKSTADSGSFNFRLNLDAQVLNQQQLQSVQSRNALETEVIALRTRVDELEDELDEADAVAGVAKTDIWDKIDKILEKPAVVGALNKLFGVNLQPKSASIGAIPMGEEKLIEAIAILKEHDARLTEHMWKLAQMAQQKPNNFKFLLSTLDSLQ